MHLCQLLLFHLEAHNSLLLCAKLLLELVDFLTHTILLFAQTLLVL